MFYRKLYPINFKRFNTLLTVVIYLKAFQEPI